jgi:hypothetical protein
LTSFERVSGALCSYESKRERSAVRSLPARQFCSCFWGALLLLTLGRISSTKNKTNLKNKPSLRGSSIRSIPDPNRQSPVLTLRIQHSLVITSEHCKEQPTEKTNRSTFQILVREITLEHIIPQKPGKGWEHLTAEEIKANTNRLGNLALLTGTVNSKIGNVSYKEKKPALLGSENSLTREAGNFATWGINEVAKRQDGLAGLAVKTWPLA